MSQPYDVYNRMHPSCWVVARRAGTDSRRDSWPPGLEITYSGNWVDVGEESRLTVGPYYAMVWSDDTGRNYWEVRCTQFQAGAAVVVVAGAGDADSPEGSKLAAGAAIRDHHRRVVSA